MVIFSGSGVNMVPLRGPVKNIVFSSEKEDVDTVIINGRTVMDNGELIGIDLHALTRELQAAGERMWPRMADHDWAGRSVDEISPMSFDLWEETMEK